MGSLEPGSNCSDCRPVRPDSTTIWPAMYGLPEQVARVRSGLNLAGPVKLDRLRDR